MKLPKILKEFVNGIQSNHLGMIASGVTFYCFLGIFPFISFCLSLYQSFFSFVQIDITHLSGVIPVEIIDTISSQMMAIESKPIYLNLNTIFSLILSIWTASLATKNFIEGLNISYQVPQYRNLTKRTFYSLFMTLILAFILFAFFSVLSLLPGILLTGASERVFQAGLWLFMVIWVFLGISFVYKFLPNHSIAIRFKDCFPGAVLTTFFLLSSTYLFGTYLKYFASYNVTYGALSSIIILLIWMRLIVLVILSGGRLNHLIMNSSELG